MLKADFYKCVYFERVSNNNRQQKSLKLIQNAIWILSPVMLKTYDDLIQYKADWGLKYPVTFHQMMYESHARVLNNYIWSKFLLNSYYSNINVTHVFFSDVI